jgi:hypothetical protein
MTTTAGPLTGVGSALVTEVTVVAVPSSVSVIVHVAPASGL